MAKRIDTTTPTEPYRRRHTPAEGYRLPTDEELELAKQPCACLPDGKIHYNLVRFARGVRIGDGSLVTDTPLPYELRLGDHCTLVRCEVSGSTWAGRHLTMVDCEVKRDFHCADNARLTGCWFDSNCDFGSYLYAKHCTFSIFTWFGYHPVFDACFGVLENLIAMRHRIAETTGVVSAELIALDKDEGASVL